MSLEINPPFEFQPDLKYVCNFKNAKIFDENGEPQSTLIFSITGYDLLFDLSLIEYKNDGDQIRVMIYKGIKELSEYNLSTKLVQTIYIPKSYQLSEV